MSRHGEPVGLATISAAQMAVAAARRRASLAKMIDNTPLLIMLGDRSNRVCSST
jgi:hypothetical protein